MCFHQCSFFLGKITLIILYMVHHKVALYGFQFTGNRPYNPNVFTEWDFALSNVTDRAMVLHDSADLLELATSVLSNESVAGDAIDLQSAASISAVGINNL